MKLFSEHVYNKGEEVHLRPSCIARHPELKEKFRNIEREIFSVVRVGTGKNGGTYQIEIYGDGEDEVFCVNYWDISPTEIAVTRKEAINIIIDYLDGEGFYDVMESVSDNISYSTLEELDLVCFPYFSIVDEKNTREDIQKGVVDLREGRN